ncbi:DUF222 domain-containing protein [Leucobacter soli]|uniref:HNH nuclease domain-containing protein n=1 Tax=Leucobacter soli TaxID=2812850 RepID=A0A916JRV7_9MICO|nr:HNH endonuclease signature motif containing protein [Leucobacter soli]CAG7598396.1 hypothetical protein LEUCIP111803_00220 [Leucobacter soli]
MRTLPHDVTEQQREALAAGIAVIESLDALGHQLEHLKAVALASLSHLATRIAHDEGHLDHGELVHRAVEAEVAVATRSGHTATASAMAHADALLSGYPTTAAALSEGTVSLRHTHVIVDAGSIIPAPAARAAYEAEALSLARAMTAHQLRAHARRLAEHYADRDIDERHREAHEGRCVRVIDLDDGMAKLIATIGAVEAYAIKDRLARIAHAARATDDHGDDGVKDRENGESGRPEVRERTGTPAQAQADLFTELLLSVDPRAPHRPAGGDSVAPITGRVQVTVPVLRLAGLPESAETASHSGSAELAGYGPIDTATARRLAGGSAAWERVLTHPVSGAVLAVDRYRPSEELRRLLRARDQHCRFPGCTRRLDQCDIDHTIPAARGGPTADKNLGHLCRKHHTLKHFEFAGGSGWHATQRPGGVYEWRSPSGRRYTEAPSSRVRFKPVTPPEPRAGPPPY